MNFSYKSQKKMKFILFLSILIKFAFFSLAFKFEEITNDIFPSGEDLGIIAAFGHFNSDEFTDIISLQQGGYKLVLLKGSENRPYFQAAQNCSFGSLITSVVPGDYNGDSVVDILITLSSGNGGESDIKILWGINGTLDCKSNTLLTLINQPFIVDFNGDMIPDIIGETKDEGRYVWISSTEKTFTNHTLKGKDHQKMKEEHSSGLIDLNNDLVPDFLIMGENDIEMWFNSGTSYVMNESMTIPYPKKSEWKFQSTFVDMNLDGNVDHLLPVCYDKKCHASAILIWNANLSKWDTLLDDFKNPNDNVNWGFKLPLRTTAIMSALPATLRAGDVDMDGYPDLIISLQSKKTATEFQTIIMRNVPCENSFVERTLKIEWNIPGLKDVQNVHLAAFFDIFEDGTLDVLLSTYANDKEGWKIHALQNTEVFDSCFLKVLVLNGLCRHHNCSSEPYGVNQPGPMVRYNMTTQEGKPLVSTSIQLSQSAYFPLQLPYSHFGLGQTPNFIDVLTVSVPAAFNKSAHKREWLQIIPNSQIVVIPHPPYDERKWVKKLFVTPSHLVLLTCISLVGTCIFLSLLVALLHWKERREDKKEKMQDAYRFHFDAM